MMSYIRKVKNAREAVNHVLGRKKSDTHMPTISSITTMVGSSPNCFSIRPEAATPINRVMTIDNDNATGVSIPGIAYRARPTKLPAVPGVMGEYPEKKPVARKRMTKGTGASLFGLCGTEISGIEVAEEFPVIKEVHYSCPDSRERDQQHHAEE